MCGRHVGMERRGVAAELTVAPAGRAAGRSVADVLDAWVARSSPTWAPASHRDETSRVARIKEHRIARVPLARLGVADVEKWHGRLRAEDLSDVSIRNLHGVLRAALTQAVRWGWITRNPASLGGCSRWRRDDRFGDRDRSPFGCDGAGRRADEDRKSAASHARRCNACWCGAGANGA